MRKAALDAGSDAFDAARRAEELRAEILRHERLYHVELWPIGNRFRAGHRLRLHIVGLSAYHSPPIPAINTVRLGPGASRLLTRGTLDRPADDDDGQHRPQLDERAIGAQRAISDRRPADQCV